MGSGVHIFVLKTYLVLKGRPSLGCTSTREGATSALKLCSTFLYPVLIDFGRRRGVGGGGGGGGGGPEGFIQGGGEGCPNPSPNLQPPAPVKFVALVNSQ